MRMPSCLLVVVLCAVVPVTTGHGTSEDVTLITDRNFFEYRQDSKKSPWVLMFYAPWCKHCQATMPYFEEAATEVKKKHGPNYLKFAKIDATSETGVSNLYGVTGYPTFKWMRDGHIRPYNGMRNAAGFSQLAQLLNSEPVTKLKTANDLTRFQDRAPVTYLLVNTEEGPVAAQMAERFSRVGSRLQDLNVFASIAPSVAKNAGVLAEVGWDPATSPAVLLRLEKGEAPQVCPPPPPQSPAAEGAEEVAAGVGETPGQTVADKAEEKAVKEMVDWVLDGQFATVSVLSKENFFDVSRGGKLTGCVVVDKKKGYGADVTKWKDLLLPVARGEGDGALTPEERAMFYFGVLDGSEEQADEYLAAFGIPMNPDTKKLELPKFIVFDFISKSDEKYYYEGMGEEAQLLDFFKGVANGTVLSQYEGNWGAPDRLWRKAKGPMPFLKNLDFLPRYTFTVLTSVLVIGWMIKCMCWDDDDDWEDFDARQAAAAKKLAERKAAREKSAAELLAAKEKERDEAAAAKKADDGDGDEDAGEESKKEAVSEGDDKEGEEDVMLTENPAAAEDDEVGIKTRLRQRKKRAD